jgi:hypothetical protein
MTMAKKTIEMDLKITFTQSVEVEVDEEMLTLIEDYWCQEINIAKCHKDPKEKKMADFLDKQVDFGNAGDINVEIELYNEV